MENNNALARIFKEMADIYAYQGLEQRFRTLAYSKAAKMIGGLKDDVSVYIKKNTLEDIPGIGESIAEKILEYVKTGKIRKYEELKKEVPHELMELMNVSGFGPQSLKQLHTELNIRSKAELIHALESGEVSKLKGFGAKKVENMLRGLKLFKQSGERMLLWDAMELGNGIVNEIKATGLVKKVETAGSLRRRKETIGDIDVLVACEPWLRKKVVAAFTTLGRTKTVLAKGDTKASIILTEHNCQVDLRIVNESEWGSALLYFTGSKEHNVHLRSIAKEKGYKINEYGVFDLKRNKRVAGDTEEEIYNFLGYEYIPPEMREEKGELLLAANNKIPKLIWLTDVKGDMQMHSSWSDGTMDIAELAAFVRKNYSYKYMVLTDHSKSERVAGGMDEKEFLEQLKAIEAVNKKIGHNFVKKGVEVDILADGSLDLPNVLLEKMDWVCASIHTGFNKDNTQRLLKACKNPFVNCIGHPSGRLIGKREEYKLNWNEVFACAVETGTAIEINAQPERMDINAELAFMAREKGVMLVISTDSHVQTNFAFMELGVWVARRAWCTTKEVLNCSDWDEVEAFVEAKRRLLANKKSKLNKHLV